MNLTTRFDASKSLNRTFAFPWNYVDLTVEQVEVSCNAFVNEYKDNVTSELCDEVKHLKFNHSANLVLQDADEQLIRTLKPTDLLNKLCEHQFREFVSKLLRCPTHVLYITSRCG